MAIAEILRVITIKEMSETFHTKGAKMELIKKTIIVALIFIMISAIIIFALKYKNNNEIETVSSSGEGVDWKALYIWDENVTLNSWLCFRKSLDIQNEEELNNVIANITVDSKYWLYVNDELVIRDGSLKRGRTPTSIYYDQVDISKYLTKGENTIAILAWHWGKDSYSHNSYAHKGLLFQAQIGDKTIISDESWKVSKNEAFLTEKAFSPNWRLPEYETIYDARLAKEDWYKKDFDDSDWASASIVESNGCELIPRDIPFFKYDEIKEYSNFSNYNDYITQKTVVIEMSLPYNMQFTPYLKIDTDEGKIIKITTDTYMTDDVASLGASYISKKGIQEYEVYSWISGEKVYYEIPAGVKIISLGYRETGYDTELTGNFETDDEFLNTLWKKAQRTLYINMRDSYMDCPDRERAQWSLDMNLEMEQALYALDPKANDLYEHGIRTILGWRNGDSLLTIVPNTNDPSQLPVQTLLTIEGMYQYYLYTGNIEFLREIYPYLEKYLELWQMNEYSVLQYNSTYYVWEWKDGSDDSDYKLLEIMSYYYAKDSVCKMADALGYSENKTKLESDLQYIKMFLNDHWTDEGYKSENEVVPNCRVNALAVLSGVASEDKYPIITKVLKENYDTGPAMEKYVLEALCVMNKHDIAIERMKARYAEMVNYDKTTLWEHWGEEIGGKNHAWSGGPLTVLSKYYAGIEPISAGYNTVSIKPKLAGLNKISSKVSTVKGDIVLDINKTKNTFTMSIETPAETIVAIPIEYSTIMINKQDISQYKYHNKDEEYVYYSIPKGKYNIDCKK